MAEYFVLDGSVKENRYRVAVHIAVPGGSNAAGKPWSAVAVEFQESTASGVPWLTAPVQAELDAGTKFEVLMNVEVDAASVSKLADFEAAIAARAALEVAKLQALLQFWGQEGTI